MSDLLAYFEDQRAKMRAMLERFIAIESPTHEKIAVDQMGAAVAEIARAHGGQIEQHPREAVGDIIFAKWNADATGKPILILAHMDTVWPLGTLERLPIHADDDGRLFGPGAVDMKGGIVIALHAIAGLQAQDALPDRPIWLLATSDEEKGSKYSREMIESAAQKAGLVLVMEPPNADGSLKTWRKGVASYRLMVTGKASHAGNEPEQGINAVIEFAQQALELNKLNDLKNGTSVSVTTVSGGTASNVIPAFVEARIDVRMMSQAVAARLHDDISERMPFMPGAQVTAERLHYRPPMERDGEAFGRVKAIASQIGLTVREDGAGGGSDGNFTAALGIPTVDGLGAEGGGLHADHEHVLLNSLPKKAALVAAILREWPTD